jgi:hypothetical protein
MQNLGKIIKKNGAIWCSAISWGIQISWTIEKRTLVRACGWHQKLHSFQLAKQSIETTLLTKWVCI